MERMTLRDDAGCACLAPGVDAQAAQARLAKYESLHEGLLLEREAVLAQMDKLRALDKTKSATYYQLIASKLTLNSMIERFTQALNRS